ncbi:hypothetical protein AJ85_05570 [Alkalihalobacillus alcalophilus ATCC 27647 = CGMCC 1.3604]|uniref:DUF4181 domain-containing protein n=1 Tax=Alkalihalobacillus alcalophilus ATCC 27647 = CGMCC 1.3604 TaxID=1218173 RepID=A0A094YSN1_ALKAL|nr:DUF4181 domain-containing protein [Alkalihalobacillus alcalophilus]KGA96492.1 hypothetical protein BALCAV_0215965 [Alkalihalobacillus alcalophilus ATCC 27647 = CGMCC 1.3604]MED1562301.1 DUF4181 domain-containing protein [Alkalihalobacillus alcalophilus]THG88372.1 hypothetical protein AJ85_05570 [Alkalihalobacillus alcalophilus ATCC 27647 = CGMCC 1.3604]
MIEIQGQEGVLVIIVLLFIYAFVSFGWLRKKYKIEKEGFYLFGKTKGQRFGESIIIVIAFMSIFVWQSPIMFLFLLYTLFFGFRSFMEWKNNKDNKVYLLTLNNVLMVAMFSVVYYFLLM